MRIKLTMFTLLLALLLPGAAHAQLPVGKIAPGFATPVAKAGEQMRFNLRSALAKGPVVLYFYPKAFTKGCTLETRAFASEMPRFEALGATVIGLSADDMDTLLRFSEKECGEKLAVGIATPAMIRGYDVSLDRDGRPTGLTERTSYVIDQSGKITFVHSAMDYRDHVRLTLDAVLKLSRK